MLAKKILLGISASLLTISPIAIMISCSSTEEKIVVEAGKFKPSTTTKKDSTSQEAVSSITSATTPQAKRAALLEFATVPTLDKEFDYEVISASIDNQVKTTVNVSIKVYEVSDEKNSKNITFLVRGFAEPNSSSNIETETAKFNKQVNTKRTDLTPVQATAMINGKNPAEALASLEILADIPTLAVGFEFIVTGATINTTTNTTIDVAITVSKTGTSDNRNVIFRVAGFQ
ncbi:MAG: hypothetical protein ACRC7B_00180, partial [Metamycoplasmataceae bacterium]